MSDFVFLAICSHCAALPDRRHSGGLGSVNCKGMRHSFLKLRMFLWISGTDLIHFARGAQRKCFRTEVSGRVFTPAFICDKLNQPSKCKQILGATPMC